MRLPLLTPLLSFLLLSTLSCSKKTDSGPVMNTGSYQIAGQAKTCQVATVVSSTPTGRTYLAVQLTTIPQPANGPEMLSVEYAKNATDPISAYQVTAIRLGSNGTTSLVFPNQTATLTSISGSISGTFSSTGFNAGSSAPFSGITDGVFTNVQL